MAEDDAETPEAAARLLAYATSQGDRSAFVRVYNSCAPKLLGWMLERANGIVPRAVLEEVCQEAFLILWRGSRTLNHSRHDPVAWLFATARTLAIHALYRQSENADALGTLQIHLPPPRPLEDGLAAEQRMERLRKVLGRLTPDEIGLLRDVYVRGLSHSKIAAKHGRPLGTVKASLNRIMIQLRRAMVEPIE